MALDSLARWNLSERNWQSSVNGEAIALLVEQCTVNGVGPKKDVFISFSLINCLRATVLLRCSALLGLFYLDTLDCYCLQPFIMSAMINVLECQGTKCITIELHTFYLSPLIATINCIYKQLHHVSDWDNFLNRVLYSVKQLRPFLPRLDALEWEFKK